MAKPKSDWSPQLVEYLAHLSEHHIGFEGVEFTDLNYRNSEGENALHAALHAEDQEDALELIRHGIDLNVKGDLGHTPLHIAASRGLSRSFKSLVEHGADLLAGDEGGDPPLFFALLRGRDDIVNYALKALFAKSLEGCLDMRVLASWRDFHLEQCRKLDAQINSEQRRS